MSWPDNGPVQQMLAELGVPVWWKPRYNDIPASEYGLTTARDPHTPAGLAHCPRCWDATEQRATSSECPVCYGTGWQGGFAAGIALSGLVTTGTYQLTQQESGELLPVAGTWLYSNPLDGLILPQDLVVVQAVPTVVYLVGTLTQMPGILSPTFVRVAQLEPQAPDSPWRLVPVP